MFKEPSLESVRAGSDESVGCEKCWNRLGRVRDAMGRRAEREEQIIAVSTSITDQFREPIVWSGHCVNEGSKVDECCGTERTRYIETAEVVEFSKAQDAGDTGAWLHQLHVG